MVDNVDIIILKKQYDEAMNEGYVFLEEFMGSEQECKDALVVLNSTENDYYIAEVITDNGSKIIYSEDVFYKI